jgi:hypothetical protein
MAVQIVRVADTIASQRAVTRMAATSNGYPPQPDASTWCSRFPAYQPPPSRGFTTSPVLHGEDDRTVSTASGAATFRAYTAAGF